MFPDAFLHFSMIRYDLGTVKSGIVIERHPILNFTIYFIFLNQYQLFFSARKHVVSQKEYQILEVFSIEIARNHESSLHALVLYKRTFFTVKWILSVESNNDWNGVFSKRVDISFLKNEIIIVGTWSRYVHKFTSWNEFPGDHDKSFHCVIISQESLRIVTLSKIVYKRNESTSFLLFSCHVLNM